MRKLSGSVAVFLLSFCLMIPLVAPAQTTADGCNAPPAEPVSFFSLPGRPFGSAVTRDGCTVFVALSGRKNGVAVLRRDSGKLSLERVVRLKGLPTEVALTHDGSLLVVADGDYVAFVDAAKAKSDGKDAVLGYIEDGDEVGSINVNVTPDDKFLFVSDERSHSITVIDLARARAEGFKSKAIIGRIPTALAPIALVFSPDGKLLYTTAEVMPPAYGWPADCPPEGRGRMNRPPGALIVVDVARAETEPAKSVIRAVPAGCSPVRMAISPDGDTLYLTARNSNALLSFNAAKLLTDPNHAQTGKVPVGEAPVPLAVADSGRKLLVGNSNRFSGGEHSQDITVIDATQVSAGKNAVFGTISAQGFPREFSASPDGRVLFLSNFSSRSLEIIDSARLADALQKPH